MNPAAPGPYDWVFQVGGWALGVVALVLLLWTVWRGRPRGQLRCPKCWYDVASLAPRGDDGRVLEHGKPLVVCPECGFRAVRRRQLSRPRVGRRWIGAALVVGMGAWVVHRSTPLKQEGWISLAPTSILVFVAPADDPFGGAASSPPPTPVPNPAWQNWFLQAPPAPAAPPPPPPVRDWNQRLGDVTWARLRSGNMWLWQSTRFLDRHFAAVGVHPAGCLAAASDWPAGLVLPVAVHDLRSLGAMPLWPIGDDPEYSRFSVMSEGRPTRAGETPRLDLRMGDGKTVMWTGSVAVPTTIREKADDCVVSVSDWSASEAVADALALRLARVDSRIIVVCDRRRDTPAWKTLQFLICARVNLVVSGRTVATGTYFGSPAAFAQDGWIELPITWEAGEEVRCTELFRQKRVDAAFVVTSDLPALFKNWRRWDFTGPMPRVFNGTFCRPAWLQTHPSISPPMPPTDD